MMDGFIDGYVYRWMGGSICGSVDGWICEYIDGWMVMCTDRWTDVYLCMISGCVYVYMYVIQIYGYMDGYVDICIYGWINLIMNCPCQFSSEVNGQSDCTLYIFAIWTKYMHHPF